MSKQNVIIYLSGGGDTVIKVVGEAVLAWIDSPRPAFKGGSCIETIPTSALVEMPDYKGTTCEVTVGSCENDRAIQAVGKSFDTLRQAMAWMNKNNIELKETWEGYLY